MDAESGCQKSYEARIRIPDDVPLIAKELGVTSNAVVHAILAKGDRRQDVYEYTRKRKKRATTGHGAQPSKLTGVCTTVRRYAHVDYVLNS
jgi:hypothetical protein